MPRANLHKAARRFARQGYPVFPCVPNEKRPLVERGFLEATTDLAQIDEWWEQWPDANIGWCPASVNRGVIDLDGEAGLEAWAGLGWSFDTPETYTVRTPRGGLHLYFVAENFPTTGYAPGRKRCVGEHIDTRGKGGYVLLPPSVTEHGTYEVIDDRDPVAMPQWLVDKLAPTAKPRKNANIKLDTPGAIDRVRRMLQAYVRRGHVAVEGEGGNNCTFHLACEVLDAGLSSDCAYEALAQHWNGECRPPWSPEELREIVENAERYQQNEPGSKAHAAPSEAFALVAEKSDLDIIGERFSEISPKNETWLWQDRFPAGSISLLAGHGDVGKTTILLDIAARITTGKGWPDGAEMQKPGRVIYLSGEDSPHKVLVPRFMAAGGDRNRIFNVRGIKAGDDGKSERLFSLQEDLAKLSHLIRKFGKPDVVIFDPLSSYFGDADTWRQSAVRAILTPIAIWCDANNIAVIGNSHLGKAKGGNANMKLLDSIAIANMSRSIYMAGRDPEEPGKRLFIPTKGNNGPEMRGLSYRLKPKMVPGDDGELVRTSCVEWSDDEVESTADEMLHHAEGGKTRRSTQADEARACALWLKEVLEREGCQPVKMVMLAANAEGFKSTLVDRARRQLGIVMGKAADGTTTMQLPGVSDW